MNCEYIINEVLELWNVGYRGSNKCIVLEEVLQDNGYDVSEFFFRWWNRHNQRELVIIRDCERGDCRLAEQGVDPLTGKTVFGYKD